MNNPSPLIPQGSLLEQKNKSRTRVRLAVFFVLSIHFIGLMALLMQGCRKPSTETETSMADTNAPAPPTMDSTNPQAVTANPNPPTQPPVVEPPTTPAPPAAQDYVVVKGDSFSSIAKKFNVKVKDIEVANPGVEPTKLQIGQKLHIPAPGSTAVAMPNGTPPGAIEMGSSGQQTYTVKSGDTLTRIAGEFGTTLKALRSENNLTTDKIKVGDKLKIPTKSSSPATPAPMTATNTTA